MITKIALTILMSLLSFLLKAQEIEKDTSTSKEGITISVTIPKTATNKGKVYFALFNSEEGFNQQVAYQKAIGELRDNKTEVQFINVPKGKYVITCYHDANENKKMDFDGMMPIEDYGSSNNPSVFGPPQFEVSKFEVAEIDLQVEIRF